MYLKKYTGTNINAFDLIKVLSEPRSNHAREIYYHMSYLSKIKDIYYKISKTAHDKLSKSSPRHTFLPGTRKEQKLQTA